MKIYGLVLYPRCGLANRLRALASAKILADYAGRKLFVNWYPSKECNIEWEELFMNKIERYPSPLSGFQAGVNLYEDKNNADGFHRDMPGSLICNNSDVVAINTCLNFKPEEIEKEAYDNAKSIFYRSLQPLHEIERIVSDIYERHFERNEIVGIHIRRTDHLSFIQKNPGLISPTDMFVAEMKNILNNNSKIRFFLATDDKKEEERMSRIFRDAVIVYEKNVLTRDTKKGMRDALIDWLLLSKTSRIISSYSSSFSEEAAIVNIIRNDPILRAEELSKIHYRISFKAHLKTHLEVLENEGFKKYILYSYQYRRGRFMNWIRKKI